MKLITRYVAGQVLGVFTVTLTALTFLLVVGGMAKEALAHGLSPWHTLQLLPYLLPNALLFAIPGTVLFAVSIVYGRMSGANEITAIKSLGVSPLALLWPTFCLATALSVVTFWLNDVAMSWGYRGVQQVVIDGIEDIAYGLLRTERSFTSNRLSVSVKQVEGHRLILPMISLATSPGSPAVMITAREAELHSQPGSGVLTITCRDGTVNIGGATYEFPDVLERDISLAELDGAADPSPAHLPLNRLPERIAERRLEIEQEQQRAAASAAYSLMTGDFDGLSGSEWTRGVARINDSQYQLNRMLAEPPRRWANGFSCLCFALVGAPLAMRLKNSEALAVFFTGFLLVLVVYYPLMMYGVDRAKAGAVPPVTVWLPNIVISLWGCWLLRRVLRH